MVYDFSGLFGYRGFAVGAGYRYFACPSRNAQRLFAARAGVVSVFPVFQAVIEPLKIVDYRVGKADEFLIFAAAAGNIARKETVPEQYQNNQRNISNISKRKDHRPEKICQQQRPLQPVNAVTAYHKSSQSVHHRKISP